MKNQLVGYATVGTNNKSKAIAFYNPIMKELGASQFFSNEKMNCWALDQTYLFAVAKPYDDNEATVGNGMMIGLPLDSSSKVDELHALALSLGGLDEGPPGQRGGGFYGAYFRDLDGNKLVFYHLG